MKHRTRHPILVLVRALLVPVLVVLLPNVPPPPGSDAASTTVFQRLGERPQPPLPVNGAPDETMRMVSPCSAPITEATSYRRG